MKTYLVTGAAGFIGANFLKYILKKYEDINVIVVDTLTYAGNLGTIKDELKDSRVKFEKVDIRNRKEIERIFSENQVDYVVNFAAESHVDRSIENPQIFLETNILGTQNLLDNAKKTWTLSKDENGYPIYREGVKYLQVSTDEVYGSLSKDYDEPIELVIDDEDVKKVVKNRKNLKTYGNKFFTEESPVDPRSPYSASKTGADHIVIAYGETYKLPINITRCSNNYGPYHFPEKLIPLMIKNILEGKKLPVYGKGDNVRDWLYVEDHCKGIDLVLREAKPREIYNIGGFNEEKNINIVKLVIDILKEELKDNRVKFEKVDIRNRKEIERIFSENKIDYVVNFAAESHVDRSIENPQIFLETNILGTQNLLDHAKKSWTVSKDKNGYPVYREGVKYLQVSTDEVYGSLSKDYNEPIELVIDDEAVKKVVKNRKDLKTYGDKFFTEESPVDPRSPYSASKTGADHIVIAYGETYKLPINITRCSNNYGPYHFPEKLIPLMIKNILEGKKLPVYGKGDNVRDWLYVEDHCKGIDLVLREAKSREIYNIGGFNEEKNINIVKLVIDILKEEITSNDEYKKVLKTDISNINHDLITYVQDRLGHDMRYAINPSKIAKDLGWYPETDFETGIRKTIKWYLENQDWVDEVVSGDYQKYYERMNFSK